ncbi:hypothetical protein [Streptomyces albidochromogenes]|uniref:hypothetical protein n=1 Tax=Streptomyces albidochromogenes TaxID=329524 RepID=UPI001FCC73A9|nr:hypothetical protein [Streptomyces albidochromogenes]
MGKDIQETLDWARQRLEELGVFATEDGLRWAAAHGLVLSVWRNGPIEDAHASRPTSRRKALHDGTMLAHNTWLTRQAFDVLGSDDQFRLYALEDMVLDRDTVWPGCEGTLTDFGWGFLGEIKKQVNSASTCSGTSRRDCRRTTSSSSPALPGSGPAMTMTVCRNGLPAWKRRCDGCAARTRSFFASGVT